MQVTGGGKQTHQVTGVNNECRVLMENFSTRFLRSGQMQHQVIERKRIQGGAMFVSICMQ